MRHEPPHPRLHARALGTASPAPAAPSPAHRPRHLQRGLAWATRDINPNVSLLQIAGANSYVVYDYVLDLISTQDTPIPGSSWAVLIANANPAEFISLGYIAEVIYHQSEIAIQAFRKAAGSGHADQAPKAAAGLGLLLADQI